MPYNFSNFQQKIKDTEAWFTRELSGVRTGRASSSFLDTVRVDSYGTAVPVSSLANIATEDPKTIRITPWDGSQTVAIEKAIIAANLGVSVAVDDRGLRVIFPELTGERRLQLVKVAKEKLEEARIALRSERNVVSDELNIKKKTAGMGEDEIFRHRGEMEKIFQDGAKKLEELFEKKEKEITS